MADDGLRISCRFGWSIAFVPRSASNRLAGVTPVMNWFQRLMPREDKFFDLFEAHAATLVAGAERCAGCSTAVPS